MRTSFYWARWFRFRLRFLLRDRQSVSELSMYTYVYPRWSWPLMFVHFSDMHLICISSSDTRRQACNIELLQDFCRAETIVWWACWPDIYSVWAWAPRIRNQDQQAWALTTHASNISFTGDTISWKKANYSSDSRLNKRIWKKEGKGTPRPTVRRATMKKRNRDNKHN